MMTKKQVQERKPDQVKRPLDRVVIREDLHCHIEQAFRKASFELSQWREDIIKMAIIKFLGSENFDFCHLAQSGQFVIDPSKKETFLFDGVPLVEFYPVELVSKRENVFSVGFNYKLLDV